MVAGDAKALESYIEAGAISHPCFNGADAIIKEECPPGVPLGTILPFIETGAGCHAAYIRLDPAGPSPGPGGSTAAALAMRLVSRPRFLSMAIGPEPRDRSVRLFFLDTLGSTAGGFALGIRSGGISSFGNVVGCNTRSLSDVVVYAQERGTPFLIPAPP